MSQPRESRNIALPEASKQPKTAKLGTHDEYLDVVVEGRYAQVPHDDVGQVVREEHQVLGAAIKKNISESFSKTEPSAKNQLCQKKISKELEKRSLYCRTH